MTVWSGKLRTITIAINKACRLVQYKSLLLFGEGFLHVLKACVTMGK